MARKAGQIGAKDVKAVKDSVNNQIETTEIEYGEKEGAW